MKFLEKIFNRNKEAVELEATAEEKSIKLLSLFTGIGAFEAALRNLNIKYELVGFSEIDKYAVKSYCAVHGESEEKNLGDIAKINVDAFKDKAIDLITYGFPCQDISIAGEMKGFKHEGETTRSGLFFEALRIIKATKPKVAICENVKNLTSKRFKKEFETVLSSLEEAGYNNYYKVLNAVDYGIPQNRERVFIISIRKDLDKNSFNFPEPKPLNLKVLDLLEDEVDEKYYMNTEKALKLIKQLIESKQLENEKVCSDGCINEPKVRNVSNCIKARYDAGISNQRSTGLVVIEPKIIQVAQLYGTAKEPNPQAGRIYDPRGISPTIDSCNGGNRMPKIVLPCIAASRGREDAKGLTMQHLELNKHGLSNSLTTVLKDNYVVEPPFKIRKLTPKECWRLMGFDDEDLLKAEAVNKNTQLYKQAGNSIVVNVLEAIFKELLKVIEL